jgi:translation initiation factor 2 alpha subunit (eIF-2alpha)
MVYYYENKLPSDGDIVIGIVEKISELGIELALPEYNNIKGFINCNEVSRKKKINFNKIFTVGKDTLLNVISSDQIKQFVDLSKKNINNDEIKLFNEKHKQHIQLYNIFKHIYMKINNINEIENINEDELSIFMINTLFIIQKNFDNEYIISKILNIELNQEVLLLINYDNLTVDNNTFKKILDDYIINKITRTKPEKTINIKLISYFSTGLTDIKYALDYKSFENYENIDIDFNIKINYISGSIYSIIIEQKNYEFNSTLQIDDVILILKNEIKKRVVEKNIKNQLEL